MTYIQRVLDQTSDSADLLAGVGGPYHEVDAVLEREDRTLWCYLRPQGRPSFTQGLLSDLHILQDVIVRLADRSVSQSPLRWVVLASHTPGLFNLGGDLTLFTRKIRERDVEGLRDYAHSCVEIAFLNATGYGGNAVTIGLAEGDAFGGGFESLLSCDVLVAERRARFALPEITFNLFPGMGAHIFLARRIGPAAAQRMILSGKLYAAEELHALGIVDVLAEDGTGERTVRDYVRANQPKAQAHAAVYKANRRLYPVALEDLRDIADIWVETAMTLEEHDLRRMTHLAAAQDRARRSVTSR